MSHTRVRYLLLPLALALTALFGGASTGQAAAANATLYSGHACFLQVQLVLTGSTLEPVECARVPQEGGAADASLLELGPITVVDGVTLNRAEIFSGEVIAQGNESHARASAADVDLTIGDTRVTAEVLAARAQAVCTGQGPMLRAETTVVGLTVGGVAVEVGTGPQTIEVGGVLVHLNQVDEERPPADPSYGATTATALVIEVPGVATIRVISVHADIGCGGPAFCPTGKDFMTGGGFFHGMPATSQKRHFAGPAGIKNGAYWGHTVYMDKAAGLKVKGNVVWYGPNISPEAIALAALPLDVIRKAFPDAPEDTGATRYRIGFLENRDGSAAGVYLVRETDAGEPGRDDQWTIVFLTLDDATGAYDFVPGAYAATSLPNGLAGGNIQHHDLCRAA